MRSLKATIQVEGKARLTLGIVALWNFSFCIKIHNFSRREDSLRLGRKRRKRKLWLQLWHQIWSWYLGSPGHLRCRGGEVIMRAKCIQRRKAFSVTTLNNQPLLCWCFRVESPLFYLIPLKDLFLARFLMPKVSRLCDLKAIDLRSHHASQATTLLLERRGMAHWRTAADRRRL